MARDGSGVYSAPAGTTATSGTTIESAKYNAFVNDLVTDANTPRPIVAGGTGASTASAARTALGLAIGTNVQAYDAALGSLAGLSWVADRYPYATGADTFAMGTITAAGRAILDDADAAAQRTTLGLGALATAASVTTSDIAAATLVTSGETIASNNNDTTIPTSAAVKAYADAAVLANIPIKAYATFDGSQASGTYTRSGTTVTATITAHGMTTGQYAYLDFTTGTATDGYYQVTVTGVDTFTVTDAASGATSGNVTRNIWTRKSSGISSIVRNGAGNYTVTLSPAMSDTSYLVIGTARWDQNNAAAEVFGFGASDSKTASSFQCRSTQSNTASNTSSPEINFMVLA